MRSSTIFTSINRNFEHRNSRDSSSQKTPKGLIKQAYNSSFSVKAGLFNPKSALIAPVEDMVEEAKDLEEVKDLEATYREILPKLPIS